MKKNFILVLVMFSTLVLSACDKNTSQEVDYHINLDNYTSRTITCEAHGLKLSQTFMEESIFQEHVHKTIRGPWRFYIEDPDGNLVQFSGSSCTVKYHN